MVRLQHYVTPKYLLIYCRAYIQKASFKNRLSCSLKSPRQHPKHHNCISDKCNAFRILLSFITVKHEWRKDIYVKETAHVNTAIVCEDAHHWHGGCSPRNSVYWGGGCTLRKWWASETVWMKWKQLLLILPRDLSPELICSFVHAVGKCPERIFAESWFWLSVLQNRI